MNVAFIGRKGLGGVKMRGGQVADALGVPCYDWQSLPDQSWDVAIVVKYWDDERIRWLRRRCRQLILDPLDCWTQTRPRMLPAEFFRWCQDQTRCDAMIATSPAMAEAMMIDAGIVSYLIPHHADPKIDASWYDPSGPVVYAGGPRFLGDHADAIALACRDNGRRFLMREGRECEQALRGASLTLSVRLGEERTPLNVACKPAVKVANAAAAGMPILCTPDPAILSLCDVPTTSGSWGDDIAAALRAGPPKCPHKLADLVPRYLEILS